MAARQARKNVAANVPRLSLLAIDIFDSVRPCFVGPNPRGSANPAGNESLCYTGSDCGIRDHVEPQ